MLVVADNRFSPASRQTRDSRGIYFPNHIEPVSHIAVDVSSSLLLFALPARVLPNRLPSNNRTIVRLFAMGIT